MPAPARTTLEDIVAAGRRLLEDGGPDTLTMQAVAQTVGVRAPSLYKRVRDRDALLELVAAATVDDLRARLEAEDGSLEALAHAYRRFAHEQPEGFRLLVLAGAAPDRLGAASAPVLAATAALVGEADALDAARLVTAWVVGFVTMELAGAFRLGGDLETSFRYGLARVSEALASPARAVSR